MEAIRFFVRSYVSYGHNYKRENIVHFLSVFRVDCVAFIHLHLRLVC